jgi:hypothetical protein
MGIALFTLGCIISICGAAKVAPGPIGTWPDSVPLFVFGTISGLLGLLLWRLGARRALAQVARTTHAAEQDDTDPAALLAALQAPAHKLAEEIERLDGHKLCERVDALVDSFVAPFGERRSQLLATYGMARGAEILVMMAFGERMLNRVWSAASDGHLPEARASFPEALDAFTEAHRLLATAE